MLKTSGDLSAYINLVRGFSAVAVTLFHIKLFGFGSVFVNDLLPSHGNVFVMVFFVVSGFVIAHTVDARRHRGPLAFAIDRAVRIYSVALPTLIICLLLGIFRPDLLPTDRAIEQPVLTFFLSLTFLSHCWSLDFYPYADGPYWSLVYEVFYYLIFGIWTFATGWTRWLCLALALMDAGPKILLLFPCWLFGVLVYKCRNVRVSTTAGWTIAIGSIVGAMWLFAVGVGDKADALAATLRGEHYIAFSSLFIRNWIIAAAFAVHLYGISQVSLNVSPRLASLAHAMAGMSFSLYLLHFPITQLATAYLSRSKDVSLAVLILAIFPTCYLFSRATEANRYRMRDWLTKVALKPSLAADRQPMALEAFCHDGPEARHGFRTEKQRSLLFALIGPAPKPLAGNGSISASRQRPRMSTTRSRPDATWMVVWGRSGSHDSSRP